MQERELSLYERHFTLLQQWNQHIGLVSRKSIDRAFAIHYADSLFISDLASPYASGLVHDLGTGAGFPGIVFSIRYPDREVRLYEKLLKKQTFLTAVLADLRLSKTTLNGAFPDAPQSGLFLARAVFPRAELFKFLSARMKNDSILITNLGGSPADLEIPNGFFKLDEKSYKLPLDQGSRRIEVIKKVPRGT